MDKEASMFMSLYEVMEINIYVDDDFSLDIVV
jgi:hypothetical protein